MMQGSSLISLSNFSAAKGKQISPPKLASSSFLKEKEVTKKLSGCNQGQSVTKKPPGYTLQKVADLITGHRWNRPLIYRLFKEKEAEDIKYSN